VPYPDVTNADKKFLEEMRHRRISSPINLEMSRETCNLVFVPRGYQLVEPCISISVFVEK
jgi:hypothetical protein